MGTAVKEPLAAEVATGWEGRLAAEVDRRRSMPFEWGVNDCAMFMVGVVEAMTGRRVWCREYCSAKEAVQIITEGGGLRAILATVAEREGWAPLSRPQYRAQRGDVVLVADFAARECLGVCVGSQAATAGEHGAAFFPMAHVVEAWRVPKVAHKSEPDIEN